MSADVSTKARPAALRLWARLWSEFSGPERHRLLVALAAMLGASGLTAILPLLIGRLVDGSLEGGTVTLSGSVDLLIVTAAIVVVGQLLQVVRRQMVENVATGFERDSRIRAYWQLLHLDLALFRKDRIGSFYGQVNRSIEGSVMLLKLGALDLFPAVTLSFAALIVAFSKNPLVAVAMLGVIPTGFALVYWQVRSQASVRVEVRNHKNSIDGQVTELLPALDTIRTNGAEDYFIGEVTSGCEDLRATELRHHRAMSIFDAMKSINEGLWLVAVLCTALALSAAGKISAGEITAYVLLFAAVLSPLRDLHRILDEASEAALQTQDLFGLLDTPVDESFAVPDTQEERPESGPAVVADRLGYAHAGTSAPLLSGLDLRIEEGERVGIVGASGCGKSTLLRLLGRLHHGFQGEIELFGESIGQVSRQRLSELVGYVAQEPRIFRMSVRDNIALGREASDAEIAEAARRAQIHDAILAMPQGYDTLIAERGDSLSGGQKQRICLARVLLGRPRILLLDEPTSALDAHSERAVQNTIDRLEGVTVVIVAHRLSTLRNTDRIVVLGTGEVIEEGHFSELATAGGAFSRMLASEREAPASSSSSPAPQPLALAAPVDGAPA